MPIIEYSSRVLGIITGIALGDSLGLPVETKSAQQIREQFGRINCFHSIKHNDFFRGHSMPDGSYSDDAQLTIAVMKAFVEAGGYSILEISRQHVIAYGESTHGWGGSTIAGVKALAEGLEPGSPEFLARLGHGTGNGIPMKAAAFACWNHRHPIPIELQIAQMKEFCGLSHPNQAALSAGLAHVAALEYCLAHSYTTFRRDDFVAQVVYASSCGGSEILSQRLSMLIDGAHWSEQQIVDAFAGGGCSVIDSLPFSYAFFLRDPFSIESLFDVVSAGGDTDSNGAFVGALQGALMGKDFFPADLVCQISNFDSLLSIGEEFLQIT